MCTPGHDRARGSGAGGGLRRSRCRLDSRRGAGSGAGRGSTQASVLGSMLIWASGHRASSSSSLGTRIPQAAASLSTLVGRERVAGVGCLDLGDAEVGERACAIGDPVQPVVVEGDQHAVTGYVRVGLEVPVAERNGDLERRERVLRCLAAPPAVRERDRAPGDRGTDAHPAPSRSAHARTSGDPPGRWQRRARGRDRAARSPRGAPRFGSIKASDQVQESALARAGRAVIVTNPIVPGYPRLGPTA